MASALPHPLNSMEQWVTGPDEFNPYAIDNWSPPLILLTPNRREFDAQDTDKSQFPTRQSLYPKFNLDNLRSKPLFQGFETPNFARIAIFIVLCLVAYPALYILTLVAKDKSLFTVRLIVAMWCSGVAFALGYTLLRIGVKHIEAASE